MVIKPRPLITYIISRFFAFKKLESIGYLINFSVPFSDVDFFIGFYVIYYMN